MTTAKSRKAPTAAKHRCASEQRRLGKAHAEAVAAAWDAYDRVRQAAAAVRIASVALADRAYENGMKKALAALHQEQQEQEGAQP